MQKPCMINRSWGLKQHIQHVIGRAWFICKDPADVRITTENCSSDYSFFCRTSSTSGRDHDFFYQMQVKSSARWGRNVQSNIMALETTLSG